MYSHLVLGGTFDHFHAGHQKLISMAFSLSKKVLLGLTVSEMNKTKAWSGLILPFEIRKREIENFAESIGRMDDLEIIPINDVYGNTLENNQLEAIVVTRHSLHGAELINSGREKSGLSRLKVHECDLFSDGMGEVLSSTRIREGLVNRSGFVYSQLFQKTLIISENIKEYVRSPLGDAHFSFPTALGEYSALIFVGDVVTESAIKNGLSISSAWIDGRSQRSTYEFPITEQYQLHSLELTNEAGTINRDVVRFMATNLLKKNSIFKINGEEDLLTLPAILMTPLQSRIVYGNPHGQKGITVVHVTEEKKEEIKSLLESLS